MGLLNQMMYSIPGSDYNSLGQIITNSPLPTTGREIWSGTFARLPMFRQDYLVIWEVNRSSPNNFKYVWNLVDNPCSLRLPNYFLTQTCFAFCFWLFWLKNFSTASFGLPLSPFCWSAFSWDHMRGYIALWQNNLHNNLSWTFNRISTEIEIWPSAKSKSQKLYFFFFL